MSTSKDKKIAELEQVIANLTAERIIPPEPEPKVFSTRHVEMQEDFVVNHEQEITCDDCAWPDGQLKDGVSCECGRSDDINTPIGEYDWE